MIIAGGVYREECLAPAWSRIFGSGGRAAAAISELSPGSTLYAYACRDWADDARRSMEAFGVSADITEIDADICFSYFHPLSTAELTPTKLPRFPAIRADGDAALRFGFVEGDAIVQAERAVYDPQHWQETFSFRDNGSVAGELAVALNEIELRISAGSSGWPAVRMPMERSGARIVVVKRGARGAAVYTDDTCALIPAFRSETVFKIGSGDVFSAVFAYLWAERRVPPAEAAEVASKAVARYVGSRNVQASLDFEAVGPSVPPNGPTGPIYLAGPFFNLAQRWLVEEARDALIALGAEVFSPLHDVGIAGDAAFIAGRDLEGLRAARAVLAIIDGEDAGTLFEVGYARDRGIPVVALAESVRRESLTMLEGSGCRIVRDFTSAVYHAIWAAME
jgi:nucleoside 2-deoxyribosyltransferase